jgi:branched-chain amino acid transport system permease protein
MTPESRLARLFLALAGGFSAVFALAAVFGVHALAVDGEQARLCRLTLPAIVERDMPIEVLRVLPETEPYSLRIEYQAGGGIRFVRCGFAGSGLDPLSSQISTFSDGERVYSPIKLHMLRRFWLNPPLAAATMDPGPGRSVVPLFIAPRAVSYFIQQLANALAPSVILALLAAAYALIYGLIGRINLAFGDIAVIGGMASVVGVSLLAATGLYVVPGSIALVAVFVLVVVTVHGVVIERLVFAPLAFGRGQSILIATVALSIVIQEYLRLGLGSEMRWLPPILSRPVAIASDGDFIATATVMQLTVGAVGTILLLLLVTLIMGTQFGRNWRAVSEDWRMAALLGVSSRRVLTQTFALACGLAGLAGFVTAMQFGGASPSGGIVLGLKALAAAVIGGIGSVNGAILGGLVLGLFQALWMAYMPIGQSDLAVLALLAVVLVLRPGGFLGYAEHRPRLV